MKVLGLVSSPRRHGNSELAVKELMRSLPEDWSKKMIRLSDMYMHSCKACYRCLSEDKHCIYPDDLNFVREQMLEADLIIIAAPCYILGAHLGIHTLLDRLMPEMENFADFAGKKCALLLSYGIPGWEGMAREEMLKIPQVLGMDFIGDVMMKATLPGESVQGENLQMLHDLAEVIGKGDGIYQQPSEVLHCPKCYSRLLTLTSQQAWRCVICGHEGSLHLTGGTLSLQSSPESDHRFSAAKRAEHEKFLLAMREDFLQRKDEIKARQAIYRDMDLWIKPGI